MTSDTCGVSMKVKKARPFGRLASSMCLELLANVFKRVFVGMLCKHLSMFCIAKYLQARNSLPCPSFAKPWPTLKCLGDLATHSWLGAFHIFAHVNVINV